MSTATLDSIAEQVKVVCERHHVRRLRLFGSTARGEDKPGSDVDLLVEYETQHVKTLASIDSLEEALQATFDGRNIDLVEPDLLHWFIKDSVLSSAVTLYER